MLFFHHLFGWWAQLEPKGGGDAVEKAAEADSKSSPFGLGFFLPMMLALVVMMLLMRPRKGNTKQKERLKTLKKNDRVATAGGILGTIVTAREDTDYVTLRIDESSNTKIQVLRSSIMRIIEDDDKKDE